jgi:photosystem II stability/assembly factor-like uncharacterized protein
VVVALAQAVAGASGVPDLQARFGFYGGPITNTLEYQRWAWAFTARATHQGVIPERARIKALEQSHRYEMQGRRSGATISSEAAGSLSLQGDQWVSIGPGPIANFSFSGAVVSGRVAGLAVSSNDLNHWYIAAAQGGVWETTDAGASWTPRTDNQASLAMGAIALAPSNPKIIYAGTGEGVGSADAYAGMGLLKSTDGGTNWQLLGANVFAKASFRDLKVSPADPNVVLAATARGIAGVSAILPPSLPPLGLYKSTDGGTNWSLKLDAHILSSGGGWCLQPHPSDFSKLYASAGSDFGNPFNASTNGVYRSTDTGDTWQLVTGPWTALTDKVERVQLALAPSNPNVLYVSIQDAIDDSSGNPGGLLGIWQTTNAWNATPTWSQLPSPVGTSDRFWYNHDIIVDPANANVLYLGEVELWKYNGSTWPDITDGIHTDQQRFAWAGNRLIVGNDGGVWSSTNGGSSWSDHNTNLAITQFYQGSLHPGNPNFGLGGSQDSGTLKWNGPLSWAFLLGGDGGFNAISSSRPDTDWAVSSQGLAIYRTTDGGNTFFGANSGINPHNALFIAPFKKCPANDDLFIAGTDTVWKTTNFFSGVSPTWVANSTPSGEFITMLAFAPSDTNGLTYAYGTLSFGQINLTTNGGSTWTNLMSFGRYVSGLAFDPRNANILYVTLSSFDDPTFPPLGHVFKTTNALAATPSFFSVSPPVDIPFNAIVLDPFNPQNVYVGTDIGVWKSTNAGTSWLHMGPETGMPNVAVFDLETSPAGRLVAFTHGRGAFALVTSPLLFAGARVGKSFSVSFDTVAGANYLLEYKNTLPDPLWQVLATVVGDGSVKTFTDTNSPGPMRFYRAVPAN